MTDSSTQRNTRQRQEVMENVMARCDHPSADDIYLSLRAEDPKISRGTVYRNLSILSENEEIGHVRVPGADRFDSRLDRHYHIICTRCGKVIDSPVDYIEANDDMTEKASGFVITRHRTIFEGICPECQKEE